MTADRAREIFDRNALCQDGSFRERLCEECCFSEEYFWEFYDSVITLAENTRENKVSVTDTAKILAVYDRVLEMFRLHCDPDEDIEIADLPEDPSGYLDRIDAAARFFLNGEPIDEDGFVLKRP
ncbi:MAG: immunity 41 family protein [Oscillospiraceae bacterium]|nr:immunity 41 family protein [Oscillospiraceae bacterium]